MGTSVNSTKCNDCDEDFDITIEWLSKESAIEVIKETKCPSCGSENWHFTDAMGQ